MATTKAYNPLLPSKQAEVARRVLSAGFRKEDFAFRDLQAREHITTLVYLPESHYRFEFYPGDNWIVNYSPADDTASSGEQGVGAWPYVLERVDWWLGCLMRELNVSDPWAGLFESVRSFDLGSGDDDNSPFSKTERERSPDNSRSSRLTCLTRASSRTQTDMRSSPRWAGLRMPKADWDASTGARSR